MFGEAPFSANPFSAIVVAGALTISGAGGVGSGESFGTTRLNQQTRIPGIATSEVFGSARANQQLRPVGIESSESAGASRLNQQIRPVGASTAATFGVPKLNEQIRPAGLSSSEIFGLPIVSVGGVIQITLAAIGEGSLRASPSSSGSVDKAGADGEGIKPDIPAGTLRQAAGAGLLN